MPPTPGLQLLWLLVLALPIASVSWTITHEEVLREPREYCQRRSRTCAHLFQRKFFFALTCEFCLSHYVALVALAATGFRLLIDDWRGFVIAWFSIVWVANFYMSIFGHLRLDIKTQRLELSKEEKEVHERERKPAVVSR
ncbi:MAG: hypothetical protein U0Q18_11500 [Bryobacteraceae bacterium]